MTCVAWRCIASGTCWLLGLDLRQRIAIATHREVVEYIIFDIMKPDDRAIVLSKLLHLSMLITLLTWLQVAPLHRCKLQSCSCTIDSTALVCYWLVRVHR